MNNRHSLFDDLVETIGITSACRIVGAWGGQRLYVPQDVNPRHPLAKVIGIDKMNVMVKMFGGDAIAVPAKKSIVRSLNNHAIMLETQVNDGKSVQQIAKQYGLSVSRVNGIKKEGMKQYG